MSAMNGTIAFGKLPSARIEVELDGTGRWGRFKFLDNAPPNNMRIPSFKIALEDGRELSVVVPLRRDGEEWTRFRLA